MAAEGKKLVICSRRADVSDIAGCIYDWLVHTTTQELITSMYEISVSFRLHDHAAWQGEKTSRVPLTTRGADHVSIFASDFAWQQSTGTHQL